MDSGSCRRQIALSHNAAEETRSAPRDDLLDNFPNLTQLSGGGGPGACTQHAVRIKDLQMAEEAKCRKNVNRVGRIRADHTTGQSGRDSSHSLVSPGEPRLDSLSMDHLSQRSAQAGTWIRSQRGRHE